MRALSLLLTALLASGCDYGVGREAPYVPAPDEASRCPSTEEALAASKRALDEGRLAELTPVAREVLFDGGGLRVLLPIVRHTSERLPVGDALAIAEGYGEGKGVARLVPHLVNVLEYMSGTSPYLEGEHYEPLDALHRVLTRCDPVRTLGALRRLLLLEVDLPDGSRTAWIHATFDALVEVAADPTFQELLGRVEFSEEGAGEGDIAVGRDAFVLLLRLVIGNVASPNFDLGYVRGVLDDVLITQLPEGAAARAKVAAFLDLLELVLDPAAEIFTDVQALMQCANREDEAGAVPGMLYDYLLIEELDFTVFLDDVDALGSDPAGEALRLAVVELSAVLEEHPDLARDGVGVVARFLAPELSRTTTPALLGLKGTGVLTELLAVLGHLLDGACR